MKPKSPPPVASKAKQLPKPSLMYGQYPDSAKLDLTAHPSKEEAWQHAFHWGPGKTIPVLVLPQPSASSARARLRFEKLSEEQKVEAMARAMCAHDELDWDKQFDSQTSGSGGIDGEAYLSSARAILALVHGRRKK